MSASKGGVVPGFRAAGIHCGIKPSGAPDLAIVASDAPARVAGVFTRSSVVGAPVEWCRERVRSGRGRAVVVNAGIANVAMGERGRRDAREMAAVAGRALGCAAEQVYVASTGVIGEPLPMGKIRRGIPRVVSALDESGLAAAAEAIRTTDTRAKTAHARTRVDGAWIHVAGIAKGSGMIEPNMATMLSFLVTDADVGAPFLRKTLRAVCDDTFNRVTVDGETSTSDTVLCFANGRAGNPTLRGPGGRGAARFRDALHEVSETLARELARDGEGATKLVTVEVTGAATPAQAETAARRIANSLLVKTAVFGGDPNWGRILQTVGAARVTVLLERARVHVGRVRVFSGRPEGAAARRRAERELAKPEVRLALHLGAGRARARVFTCDLSTDYVRINADYTT